MIEIILIAVAILLGSLVGQIIFYGAIYLYEKWEDRS